MELREFQARIRRVAIVGQALAKMVIRVLLVKPLLINGIIQ